MAQSEDTELRDLVIEALEKNGSLPKIRALLRANIFLAFEDECNNLSHNTTLDNILKNPDGVLSLTIIHEFLEYCNLKNTMFVYVAETRQGKEYSYENRKKLAEKLNLLNVDNKQEPILLTIIKHFLKPFRKKYLEQGDHDAELVANLHNNKTVPKNMKDEQNSTYIVHEDTSSVQDTSSSQSQSQSDNSLDEKNRLHLRLPLDTSDTDTSTDSNRDKSHSEYIPNQNIHVDDSEDENKKIEEIRTYTKDNIEKPLNEAKIQSAIQNSPHVQGNVANITTNSSDSTSYVELDPHNNYFKYSSSEILKNISTLLKGNNTNLQESMLAHNLTQIEMSVDSHHVKEKTAENKNNTSQTVFVESKSSCNKNELQPHESVAEHNIQEKLSPQESVKSEVATPEYSLNFTMSPNKHEENLKSPNSIIDNDSESPSNNDIFNSKQNSCSSQSSVSISDVADMLEQSETSLPLVHANNSARGQLISNAANIHYAQEYMQNNSHKSPRDLSGDYSGSSIPSLSNLSLEIHSD